HNAAMAAKRDGFSLAIRGADHHPDGKTIATLIAVIAAHLDNPKALLLALPTEVELYAIG
ncbi:alpha/beta hydrolase, partial [Sphingomonas sp. HMWF008]